MKTTILKECTTLDECYDELEKAKDNNLWFNLGGGYYGKIKDFTYFQHNNGIDEVIFEMARTKEYLEEKRRLQDDWVMQTNNWLEYCFGIKI